MPTTRRHLSVLVLMVQGSVGRKVKDTTASVSDANKGTRSPITTHTAHFPTAQTGSPADL